MVIFHSYSYVSLPEGIIYPDFFPIEKAMHIFQDFHSNLRQDPNEDLGFGEVSVGFSDAWRCGLGILRPARGMLYRYPQKDI